MLPALHTWHTRRPKFRQSIFHSPPRILQRRRVGYGPLETPLETVAESEAWDSGQPMDFVNCLQLQRSFHLPKLSFVGAASINPLDQHPLHPL